MIRQLLRRAILGLCLVFVGLPRVHAQATTTPFTILSNNADVANKKLYVELMYEKSSCSDYKAQFRLESKANPAGVVVAVDSFLNNPGTYETEQSGADKYKSLMRPTAGGYRLRFALPANASVADSFRICVITSTMAYRCMGCAAGGSDAIFGAQDIDAACPYKGADLLACYRRESTEANWEAWIQDSRDCQPYRIVAMPDGRWWFAQNLNYQKDLAMYNASGNGPTSVPSGADGGFWCPGGKSFSASGVTDFNNAIAVSGGLVSCKSYGALYTWATANSLNGRSALSPQPVVGATSAAQGICPNGWLLPSEFDWGVLLNAVEGCSSPSTVNGVAPCNHARSDAAVGFLGSQSAKALLKSTRSCPPHATAVDTLCATVFQPRWTWRRSDYGTKLAMPLALGNDRYGFALYPSGYRANDGSTFQQVGTGSRFWSAGESGTLGYARNITNNEKTVELSLTRKDYGQSVRCVKGGVLGDFFLYPAGNGALSMAVNASSMSLGCLSLGSGWSYAWSVSPQTNVTLSANATTATLSASGALSVGASYTITVVATKSGETSRTASKVLRIVATPPVELPSLGLAGIYANPTGTGSRNASINLSAYSAVQPAGATYEWVATSRTAGAPSWVLGTSTTSGFTATTPNVSTATAYTISVTMKASGYQSATVSTEYAIRGCDAVAQGAMPAEQTVCPGAGVLAAINPTVTGGDTYTYQWQQRVGSGSWTDIAGATAASYAPTAPTTANQLVYYRRVVSSCGQTSYSGEWKLMTYGGITQPVLAQVNACPNTATTLSLGAATGGGVNTPTYQWQSSSDNVSFSNIGGATGQTVTVTSNATSGAYNYYRRIATGTCAGITHTSDVTPLRSTATGNFSQTFTASTVRACPGANIGAVMPAVNNTGAGSPTAYQWQVYQTLTNAWSDIAGATGASYTPAITSHATAGVTQNYRRGANVCGTWNYSGNVLTVVSDGNITQPTVTANQSACPNAPLTLTMGAATGGSGSFTYKWQSSADGTSWTDLTGYAAGNINYTYTPTATGTTMFRRLVQSCATVATNIGGVITVAVRQGLTQPAVSDLQVCAGGMATFNVGAATGGSNITYQWQQFSAGANAWVDMGGRTNDTLVVKAPATGGAYSTQYRRRAISTDCGSSATGSARVYALAASVGVESNLKSLYETSPNMPVVLAPAIKGEGAITYQWYSSTDNNLYTPVGGATNPTLTVTLSGEGEYSPYYRLQANVACGDISATGNAARVYTTVTCPYKGADLVDGSCAKRTLGVQNWEATIKDSRDNRTYRIVQMPGGDWWFAQNLAHKKGVERVDWQYNFTDDASRYEANGLQYPYFNQPCPAGWKAPAASNWEALFNCVLGDCNSKVYNINYDVDARNLSTAANNNTVALKLRAAEVWNTYTTVGTDDYGFSLKYADGLGDRNRTDTWTAFRTSVTDPRTIMINASASTTIDQRYTGVPTEMKQCCGSVGSYVRCIADTMPATSTAPSKIEASYISVTSGGSTTLTAKDAVLGSGASYQWGTGTVGSNIIAGQTRDVITVTLTATTTYWVRVLNADGTATNAATISIAVAACPYTQADLVRVLECRQRGTGAENWEAYVRDSRDSKEYRVVFMPDRKWWFAQNLNYQTGLTYRSTWSSPNTGTDIASTDALKGSFWCSTDNYIGDASSDVPSGGLSACNVWGALYSWATMVSPDGTGGTLSASSSNNNNPSGVRGVCPNNWHVPSRIEWDVMMQCVDGDCTSKIYQESLWSWVGGAAKKLKSNTYGGTPSVSNPVWVLSADNKGTDEYGFSLIPAGWKTNGGYGVMGIYAMMGTISTRNDYEPALPARHPEYNIKYFQYANERAYSNGSLNMSHATAVRCVTNVVTPTTSIAPTELWANYTGVGSGTSITINAKGAVLASGAAYQWGVGRDAGSNVIAGQTAVSLTVSPTSPVAGRDTVLYYWCRVSNGGGVFTDAVTIPIQVQNATVCPYRGGDLVAGSCKPRGDRARNWTAQITDARDGRVYNIVLMPDGKWWLGENLKYTTGLGEATLASLPTNAGGKNDLFKGVYWCPPLTTYTTTNASVTGGGTAGCEKFGALYPWNTFMSIDGVGATYSGNEESPEKWQGICPAGWHINTVQEMANMFNCVEGNCATDVFGTLANSWRGLRVGNHLRIVGQFPTNQSESWDSYGFGKEASGYRHENGQYFYDIRYASMFTAACNNATSQAGGWIHYVYPGAITIKAGNGYNFARGGSVRCMWNGDTAAQVVTTAPTSLTADAKPITNGITATLTAKGGSMRPGAVYEWGTGTTIGSNIIAGTGSSISVNPAVTTTYWVRRVDGGTPTAGLTLAITVTGCPYPGADLVAGSCKTRSEGMRNWTARIAATDGNQYDVVQVGNMWVFAQDLRTTTGTGASTRAQMGTDPTRFTYSPAAIYSNNSANRSAVGAATGQQSICPAGWTLPSSNQMINLANCASGTCGTAQWTYDRYTHHSLFVPGCAYASVNQDPTDFETFAACNNAWGANLWGGWRGNWDHVMPLVDGPISNGAVWHFGGFNETAWIRRMGWLGTTGVYSWAGTSCHDYTAGAQGECRNLPIRCVRATTCIDNITAQGTPGNATMNPGETRTFSATVTGGVTFGQITYQWQVSYDGGASYVPIQGATSMDLTYTTSTGDAPNVLIRRVATSSCGNAHTSPAATITMNRPVGCPYTPLDGEQLQNCTRRGTGAQNWTASIVDTRDGQRYAILRGANGRWLTAQPMAYNIGTNTLSGGTLGRYYNNTSYIAKNNMCPPGWRLTKFYDWGELFPYDLPTADAFRDHWGFLNSISSANYAHDGGAGNINTHLLVDTDCDRPGQAYVWDKIGPNVYRGGKLSSNEGCSYTWPGVRYHCMRDN